MKRRLFKCTLVLALLALCGSSSADNLLPPVPVPPELANPANLRDDAAPARKEGVATLASLAKSGDPTRLGFSAAPGIADIIVLAPFQEALVQVSDLKTFTLTKDPSSIVQLQARETYPIALTGKGPAAGGSGPLVVSSLTIAKRGTDWRATSYGSPNLMRAAFGAFRSARDFKLPGQAQPLLLRSAQQNYLLVRVTGLNKVFLGALADTIPKVPNRTALYLIPIFDNQALGLVKGVPQLASVVFAKLKPAALLHNGLPT